MTRLVSAVPDVLAPGLKVVFCGINPGRASAAAGAHFANPRNDFWRLLHAAGFTAHLLAPNEQFDLLSLGYGLTNAARRITRGSGDLRSADFAGSAQRLDDMASQLEPGVIAFVGKEAYRGTFRERPRLGLQARRLSNTSLFVLPSTSPANAAVPWAERLRWFRLLGERATKGAIREAARAIVVDGEERVLLVRFEFLDGSSVWATVGGGLEPGETHEDAARRELLEEAGLDMVELGPCIWTREHLFSEPIVFEGQRERYFLVRAPAFEPAPRQSWEQLNAEGMTAIRWWTLDEIEGAAERFAPRRLAHLLRTLLRDGPPPEPVDVGV